MLKYILILAAAATAVYFFFRDPYPDHLVFDGYKLESRSDANDSLNQEIDILAYRDKSNEHVLILGFPNDSPDVTLEGLKNQYLRNFRGQGIRFTEQGNRWLGSKDNFIMYITQSEPLSALMIYTESVANVQQINERTDRIFSDLENYSF